VRAAIEDPDAPLVPCAAQASQGDVATADALFPLVYRQMRAICGGRVQDLDDLVQTALEQTLRALPGFEGRAKLSTWVYRICYLTLLKHRRWYRRWLRRFELTWDGDMPELPSEAHAGTATEAAERSERLRGALERLSPKRRAVLVLHDLEGLDVNEIAEIVEANPLTVRSRLRDGRRDLAKVLADDPYFGDAVCEVEEP
jgi:RNA polymerase sigma-70 factor (ECF subfamily)